MVEVNGSGDREATVPHPSAAGFAVLARLSTAAVSDALTRRGHAGEAVLPGIVGLQPRFRIAGPAFTVVFGSASESSTFSDYLDDVPGGHVLVLDAGGRTDCTLWGGLLSVEARRRGLLGTVAYGVCRDIDEATSAGYPVFGCGRSPRSGRGIIGVVGVQRRLEIGDVIVEPGDLVLGDGDGVLIVPSAEAGAIVALADEIEERDSRIAAMVTGGMRLDDARRSVER